MQRTNMHLDKKTLEILEGIKQRGGIPYAETIRHCVKVVGPSLWGGYSLTGKIASKRMVQESFGPFVAEHLAPSDALTEVKLDEIICMEQTQRGVLVFGKTGGADCVIVLDRENGTKAKALYFQE